jgi:hypothetical protein
LLLRTAKATHKGHAYSAVLKALAAHIQGHNVAAQAPDEYLDGLGKDFDPKQADHLQDPRRLQRNPAQNKDTAMHHGYAGYAGLMLLLALDKSHDQ